MEVFKYYALLISVLLVNGLHGTVLEEAIKACDREAVQDYLRSNTLSSIDKQRYLDLAEHSICMVDREFDLYNSGVKTDQEPGELVVVVGVMGMMMSGISFFAYDSYKNPFIPVFLAMAGLTTLGVRSCDSNRAEKKKKRRVDDCANALAIKQLIYQA